MNVVMIIPTGIGCEIGGHAGDATPAAKLLGVCCDKLILHPNVVNASDINEMPENALYVEGSMLDRFLEGKIDLQEVRQNKILVVVNSPVRNHTINAVSAARATIGLKAKIVELKKPLIMQVGWEDNGVASGRVSGFQSLIEQVQEYDFDALAVVTGIDVSDEVMLEYFNKGGVNPIGGVEAKASKLISAKLNKPVAHAPFEEWNSPLWKYNEIVNPRLAAEMISNCFLHCVLKGLHKAPRIGEGLTVKDVDYLVTPMNCVSRPHEACMKAKIPIIAVKENRTILNDPMPKDWIFVENYWEAAGYLMCMRIGIEPESVRQQLRQTEIIT